MSDEIQPLICKKKKNVNFTNVFNSLYFRVEAMYGGNDDWGLLVTIHDKNDVAAKTHVNTLQLPKFSSREVAKRTERK